MWVPNNVFRLLQKQGFLDAVQEGVKNGFTLVSAYSLVESVYSKWFGVRRYASFDSFKRVYYRELHKKENHERN